MRLSFRFLLIFALLGHAPLQAADKTIIGWLEPAKIHINGEEYEFSSKIDTGADYSSIDIESLDLIDKKNKPWVRFEIEDDNGKLRAIELPVHKITKVKRKGTDSQPRFVVMMDICIDGKKESTRVSLVDRHNFKYRLLIGRSFLKDKFIIDPAVKMTTTANCQ